MTTRQAGAGQAAVPRNAPCPCGSGRRYKHCHGRPAAPAAIPADPRQRMAAEIPLLGATAEEMRALFAESERERGRYADALAQVRSYLLFIGYPHSGHSLVGALLDAHPDMVVAHELDVLRFQAAGFDREQIAYLLIRNAELFAEAGRRWGGYDYGVPGQWQGRFRRLSVLGDKKGGGTTVEIGRRPERLDALLALFEGRVRFLHVLRNPFDVVATMSRKSSQDLAGAIETIGALCAINAAARERLGPERCLDVRHEALVAEPRETLERLCGFLGVAAPSDYLEACAGAVAPQARRSRDRVTWREADKARLAALIERFDFLAGYGFDT